MAKRQSISKTTRFEVFKRDKFTCQYCGRMAPDVILEVDHIKPVYEGGDNIILNLVTACRDCNRGKGKRVLSDDSVVKKQQEQLKDIADKNEQIEMILEWRKSLVSQKEKMLMSACEFWEVAFYGSHINEHGKATMLSLLCRFSFTEVLDAIEIASYTYPNSPEYAFNKLGGICYNIRRQAKEDE